MEAPPTNVPSDDTRFRVELQFINLLSDPRYISCKILHFFFIEIFILIHMFRNHS